MIYISDFKMLLKLYVVAILAASIIQICLSFQLFREEVIVNSSELTVFTIKPSMFNWGDIGDSELGNQIEYIARISNSPDLPSWLQYTYDGLTSTAYLYGVPPRDVGTIDIDVIARNRNHSFDARQLIITFSVIPQQEMEFVMEFKIDNMNARDFCNPKEILRLANTFANYLDWQHKDGSPVSPVYLRSASDVGESHFSVGPFEADGVIVHLGSDKNFSTEMHKLQKEVLPLWRLRPCPRNLKRTSVEKYFRSQRFFVDWCSFKLKSNPKDQDVETSNSNDGKLEIDLGENAEKAFYFRSEIPTKSYTGSILLVTIVPGTLGSLIAVIIIGIFWNDEDETMPVFKNQDQPANAGIVQNPMTAEELFQPYQNVPMGGDDYFLITGEEGRHEHEEARRQERAMTPQPPQYGNAMHPKSCFVTFGVKEGAGQHSHYSIDFARSLPPIFVNIGGLQCWSDVGQLPDEFKDFQDGSEGVVLIAFGSTINFATLDPIFTNAFLNMMRKFSRVRFIWRWDGQLTEAPQNLKSAHRLPQREILNHPKTVAFITHGGFNSVTEATFHAVPLIVFPLIADQDFHAHRITAQELGISVEFNTFSQISLDAAVGEILRNKMYKKNMVTRSKIFKDRIRSPIEEAVSWTEFALRQDDTSALKPMLLDQSWLLYIINRIIKLIVAPK